MKRSFLSIFFLISLVSFSQSQADTINIKRTSCPVCRSNKDVIPVVYSKPGKAAIDKAEKGACYPGGCVITRNSRWYYCRKDKKKF